MASNWPFSTSGGRGSGTASMFVNWAVGIPIKAVGAFAESLTNPFTREAYYQANNLNRNVTPNFDIASQLYYSGKVNSSDYSLLCSYNGIAMSISRPESELTLTQKAWRFASELSHPRGGVEMYHDLFHRGLIRADTFSRRLDVAGLTTAVDRNLWFSRKNFGTIEDAQDFYRRGRLDAAGLEHYINRNGVWDETYINNCKWDVTPLAIQQIRGQWVEFGIGDERLNNELALAGYGREGDRSRVWNNPIPYSPTLAVSLFWRGEIDAGRRDDVLWYSGLVSNRQKEEFQKAIRPIPGPSDLVRFAVREAWDQQVVNDFGYDAEFPEEMRQWMHAQGYGWTRDITLADGTVRAGVEWPLLYWRSHWQVLSPTIAYEMYHRLRPERIARYTREWPDLRPFTRGNLDTVLKINDFPPAVRDWLGAVSMRKLDARGLRSMFIRNVRPRAWVRQQLLDWGYTEEDADAKLEQWWADFQWTENTHVRSRYKRAETDIINIALDSYANGLIDEDRCRSTLEGMGVPPEYVTSMMQVEVSKKAVRYIKDVIKQLRRDFMLGATNLDEVGTLLIRAGVVGAERTRLLQEWILRKSMSRRIQSAAWVIGMVKRGLLSIPNGQTRLANLGWLAPDIALATASILQDTAKAEAKIGAAGGKQRLAAQKQLVSARKQAVQAAKSAQAELRRLYPKSDLKKWLQRGWRSEAWVAARLREQGYPDDFVRLTIAEWASPPANKNAKKGTQTANGEAGGASGGGTG